MRPDITYFIGPPSRAVLAPLHFQTIAHAENNTWRISSLGKKWELNYLFVYNHEKLLLVIDHNDLWCRAAEKWKNLKSIRGRYSYEDILHRYVKFAVYRALRVNVV